MDHRERRASSVVARAVNASVAAGRVATGEGPFRDPWRCRRRAARRSRSWQGISARQESLGSPVLVLVEVDGRRVSRRAAQRGGCRRTAGVWRWWCSGARNGRFGGRRSGVGGRRGAPGVVEGTRVSKSDRVDQLNAGEVSAGESEGELLSSWRSRAHREGLCLGGLRRWNGDLIGASQQRRRSRSWLA